jgi:hypothetical protein
MRRYLLPGLALAAVAAIAAWLLLVAVPRWYTEAEPDQPAAADTGPAETEMRKIKATLYYVSPGGFQLVAHAAGTRPLAAGTIIGSGTIANQDESRGSSCLAEKRVLEIIAEGEARTPFMSFGDTVRIEMLDGDGHSVFGAVEHIVTRSEPA